MREYLLDIRAGIKAGRYVHEATVSQGKVQRLLNALGWSPFHCGTTARFVSRASRKFPPASLTAKRHGRVFGSRYQDYRLIGAYQP